MARSSSRPHGRNRFPHSTVPAVPAGTCETPPRCDPGAEIREDSFRRCACDVVGDLPAEEILRLTQASIEVASEMVAWLTPDGAVRYANLAASRELGYTREELLRMTAFDLIPGLTPEKYASRWSEIRARKSLTHQMTHRRKDGSLVPVEVLINHLTFGGKEYIFVYGHDITERQAADEALRQRVEEVERMLEAVPAAVWVSRDPRCETIIGNALANRFYEAPPGENVSATTWPDVRRFFTPDGRELSAQELPMQKAVATNQELRDVELRVLRPSGKWLSMFGSAVPLRDQEGKVRGCIGAFLDVTARREAEDALRESHARLSKVLEIETVGVMFWDLETGCMVDANDTFLNLMGYSRKEVEARELTWQRLTPPEHYDVSMAEARRFYATGRVGPYEKEYFRKDGTRRWLLFAGSSLGDSQCVEFCVDVSERKRMEEALRLANSEFLEADRKKNEFLGVLSHELRNPLAPIVNSLFVLDHTVPGGEEAKRAREVIGRQVAQLSHLVNDLLDITRITRGKVQLHRQPLDLNETVARAVEDHRSLFEGTGVDLDFCPARGVVPVLADPNRVTQIVGNLLHNAAKFTNRGGYATVSVETEKGEAVLRVSDNGVGMTPQTRERLFEPFRQAEQTLDRNTGGLGLGLALVKGLVELHGGTVSAHSAGPGRGTAISARFPLNQA